VASDLTLALDSVPSIDIAPWRQGVDRAAVARQVAAACEEIGFVLISGHGISDALFERALAVSRDFFDLPEDVKLLSAPKAAVAPRGYAAMATKGLARTLAGADQPADLREQFMLGPLDARPREWFPDLPEAWDVYSPNIWPQAPSAYRDVFTELYHAFERLSTDLMRIFASGLKLPEDYFDAALTRHFGVLGSNHYPPPSVKPLPGQLRTGAHTDFGSLTILLATGAPGGLEVYTRDGTWLPVFARPGELIVNIGDMMARWTNDRWRSTLHRVVNPPDDAGAMSRRQSIAFFLHPNYDAEVACLPTCLEPGRSPLYPPIIAGRHMREKMQKR
jgi:isopenicillin N synthase-like dioxygenase